MSVSRRAAPVLLALLALFAAPAAADAPEEIFLAANTAYEAGRYEEAAASYRSLLRYRIQDPRLEYNLANAEFRLGHLGRAILHYERALRLDPTDPDIRSNLELTRSLLLDRVEEPPLPWPVRWVRSVQDSVGVDRQAWLLLALLWAICGVAAWCGARPGGWTAAWGWGLAALLTVAALAAISCYTTQRRQTGGRRAIVLGELVEVLAGPGGNNPTLATVHEGLAVDVVSERQDWLQVRLPNGVNGWIPHASAEPI